MNSREIAGAALFHISECFSPYGAQAILLLLCGLSGRTNTPVSARTIGNSDAHTDMAMALEDVLGRAHAIYITAASDSGIVALGDKDGPRTILYDGTIADEFGDAPMGRLIRGKPLRYLDAPAHETRRLREFNEKAAVILFAADAVSDPRLLGRMITVRLHDQKTFRHQHASRSLERFLSDDTQPALDRAAQMQELKRWFERIKWKTPVIFEGVAEMIARTATAGDVHRLEQLLALTSVLVLLKEAPIGQQDPIWGHSDEIRFVVALLRTVGAEDDRQAVPVRALNLLRSLQNYVQASGQTPEAYRSTGLQGQTSSLVRFSVYDLKNDKAFAALSPDALDDLLRILEKKGMVAKAGRQNRRRLWELTPWGFDHKRRDLADALTEITGNSADLGGPAGDDHRETAPPPDGPPAASATNSPSQTK